MERYYFNLWRNNTMFRKYDKWCEIQEEEQNENNYAQENGMDSIYWCWNCKYSDCEIHLKT